MKAVIEARTNQDELLQIPGVGVSIADDLRQIGIYKVADLAHEDPEALYQKSNLAVGAAQDRCLLYTFRCAVYYASNGEHDPYKLKWWNYQDSKMEGKL